MHRAIAHAFDPMLPLLVRGAAPSADHNHLCCCCSRSARYARNNLWRVQCMLFFHVVLIITWCAGAIDLGTNPIPGGGIPAQAWQARTPVPHCDGINLTLTQRAPFSSFFLFFTFTASFVFSFFLFFPFFTSPLAFFTPPPCFLQQSLAPRAPFLHPPSLQRFPPPCD